MEGLHQLLYGFEVALTAENLLYAFLGALLGTMVGVLPGLGPSAAIALLLPLTYQIGSPVGAIIMLAGIFYGAQYGGSTTSILLNIPGEAASVVTTLDGYQMARKGQAGSALGVAAIGSFVAGTLGVVGLTLIAPPLGELALRFGPPEYFALALFGLLLTPYLTSGSAVKGMLMVLAGLLLGTIGFDPISGVPRFAQGIFELQDGLDFSPVVIGLFGLGEILYNLEQREQASMVISRVTNVFPKLIDIIQSKWAILRGSIIGFVIGLIPGGGATIASLVGYAVEKRLAKDPSRFGQGAIEGVASPESANNSAASASFIPLLTLGIPGNASIAMIFTGLAIQGVQPGPLMMVDYPDVFWGVVASMYIGNVMLLLLNLPLVGLWVQLLRVPERILVPAILLISVVGSFSIRNSVFDVGLMMAFGVLGYLLRKYKFEFGPLVLAFVLGPILEESLRQSLLIARGDVTIFLTRPISGALTGVFLLAVLVRFLWPVLKGRFGKNHPVAA